MIQKDERKPVEWIGSSRDDLKSFPEEVRQEVGYALLEAQTGRKSKNAKPSEVDGVMKIVSNFDSNAYRVFYSVKLGSTVYALHCFQKKSTQGIKTSLNDINLVKRRLKLAQEHYNAQKK
jgi:phage-related protein